MSIKVMTTVWTEAPYQGGALLILLAMADWADDNGYCWPSVRTLARKSRQSERNVRKCLARMKGEGTISVETNAGPHSTNRYQIKFRQFKDCGSLKRAALSSGVNGVQPEQWGTEPLSLVPEGGERSSPNTSIDTSVEPSTLAIRGVFDYYLQTLGRNPKTCDLTPLRKQMGVARLAECLKKTDGNLESAVALMKVAIDTLAASTWHMGRDQRTNGKRYCEWDKHLFGSYEQMERWWNA